MAQCTRSLKVKVANKVTHSCHCSSLSDNTVHWRMPVHSCCLGNISSRSMIFHMVTMPEREGLCMPSWRNS